MAFDYKKEYKEFYMPENKPGILTVPGMNYMAVRGEDEKYKQVRNSVYSQKVCKVTQFLRFSQDEKIPKHTFLHTFLSKKWFCRNFAAKPFFKFKYFL